MQLVSKYLHLVIGLFRSCFIFGICMHAEMNTENSNTYWFDMYFIKTVKLVKVRLTKIDSTIKKNRLTLLRRRA